MKADITLKSILQDTQDYASFDKNDAHMVSRIVFDAKIGDTEHQDLVVEIRQPFGTDYESEPIEVSKVSNYDGPWNHSAFSDICEQYYRGIVGQSGRGIRIEGGGNIRMRENQFHMPAQASFDLPDGEASTW